MGNVGYGWLNNGLVGIELSSSGDTTLVDPGEVTIRRGPHETSAFLLVDLPMGKIQRVGEKVVGYQPVTLLIDNKEEKGFLPVP